MTLKKLAVIVFPAIALAFATSGHAQAGLVENGSFETATTFNDSKQTFDQAGVTGWSGGSNLTYLAAPGTSDGPYLAVYSGLPATSPDGGNFVEADGDPNYSSTISQTLTGLTVGQAYAVSFFQAAGQQAGFTGPTTEEWKVGLGSDYQYSSQFSLAQGATGNWEAQTLNFTATSTSEVLSFLAVGTPNGAPPISFLDGVAVNSVPEPTTVVLLGLGLLGVGAVKLRRRARSTTV